MTEGWVRAEKAVIKKGSGSEVYLEGRFGRNLGWNRVHSTTSGKNNQIDEGTFTSITQYPNNTRLAHVYARMLSHD